MSRRHPKPLPRIWLMTDERMGDKLFHALNAMPRGSGVVFRHYGVAPAERRALFARVRRVCRRRHLLLILAGDQKTAQAWRADGHHGAGNRTGSPAMIYTVAAHKRTEIVAAARNGADLVMVSPVFATASHPHAVPLGRICFGLMTLQAAIPVLALGGMTETRARTMRGLGIYGWAGIDAFTAPNTQKRKAVPT